MFVIRIIVRCILIFYVTSCLFFIFYFEDHYIYNSIKKLVNGISEFKPYINEFYFKECSSKNCDFFLFMFDYTQFIFILLFLIMLIFSSIKILFDKNEFYISEYDPRIIAYQKIYVDLGYSIFKYISYPNKRTTSCISDGKSITLFELLVILARRSTFWSSYLFDAVLVFGCVAFLTPIIDVDIFSRIFSTGICFLVVSFTLGKLYEILLIVISLLIVLFKNKGVLDNVKY